MRKLRFHLSLHSPCVIFAVAKTSDSVLAKPNEKTSFSFVSALTFHYLCRSLIYHLECTYLIRLKKYILDLTLTANEHLRAGYALLKLTHEQPLPKMCPGQFAELKVDGSETTFLRRPISVNYVDEEKNEVWFLIHEIGDGTRTTRSCRK